MTFDRDNKPHGLSLVFGEKGLAPDHGEWDMVIWDGLSASLNEKDKEVILFHTARVLMETVK